MCVSCVRLICNIYRNNIKSLQHIHINSNSENALILTCENGDDYGKNVLGFNVISIVLQISRTHDTHTHAIARGRIECTVPRSSLQISTASSAAHYYE